MTGTITIDQMKDKLIPLSDLRQTLAKSEPVTEETFTLGGKSGPKVELGAGWSVGVSSLKPEDPIEAWVTVNGKEFQFTNEALFEVTASIGMLGKFVKSTPANLLQPVINHYLASQPEKEMKFLINEERALAYLKGTIEPFSNLSLLDKTLDAITEKYGEGDLYADYKYQHDFRHTAFRLIIPNEVRQVREGDPWSGGIQVVNSLIGKAQTALRGYLFRWWCTNGAITLANDSSHWSRKSSGKDGGNVYEWAQTTVDSILGGFDEEFAALDDLANTPLHEDEDLADALRDVFERGRIPTRMREGIVDNLVNSDDRTMYGVMQAITQAANSDSVPEHTRELLMSVGGELPRANEHRCGSCHRLL